MTLYFDKNNTDRPRYAIYANKRLGGAVDRNRIKRIFREVLNQKKTGLGGHDFIIIPREGSIGLSFQDIRLQVETIFIETGILTG